MTRREDFRLKAATRQLIERNGGQTYAAEQTRVPQSNLSDYASVHKPDRFMPADVILDLEVAIGEPVVTRELADQQGYVLVKTDAISNAQGLTGLSVALTKAYAPFISEFLGALEGGTFDEAERQRLIATLKPLQDAVSKLAYTLGRPA